MSSLISAFIVSRKYSLMNKYYQLFLVFMINGKSITVKFYILFYFFYFFFCPASVTWLSFYSFNVFVSINWSISFICKFIFFSQPKKKSIFIFKTLNCLNLAIISHTERGVSGVRGWKFKLPIKIKKYVCLCCLLLQ